jgi:hypothetical protein
MKLDRNTLIYLNLLLTTVFTVTINNLCSSVIFCIHSLKVKLETEICACDAFPKEIIKIHESIDKNVRDI